MKKADREIVLDKTGGCCAYCGIELTGKWHVDHCEPVNRTQKVKQGYYKHKITGEKWVDKTGLGRMPPDKWWQEWEFVDRKLVFDKMMNPENDTVENSLPSCLSCNITKGNYNVQEFREWIQQTVDAMNKGNYNSYKFAKRYGLVKETIKPVIFYFETLIPTR